MADKLKQEDIYVILLEAPNHTIMITRRASLFHGGIYCSCNSKTHWYDMGFAIDHVQEGV